MSFVCAKSLLGHLYTVHASTSMWAFLQQTYVFAIAAAVLTAAVIYFYTKTLDKDEQCNKAFFKTLTAGLIVGLGLAYISTPRAEPILTEPFIESSPAI